MLCFHACLLVDALLSPVGKGWPLGSHLWCLIVTLSLFHWYPGSGVVLDCINSWSSPSFLLKSLRCWFIMLINVKMPTIIGILSFMSRINFVLSWVEHGFFYNYDLELTQWPEISHHPKRGSAVSYIEMLCNYGKKHTELYGLWLNVLLCYYVNPRESSSLFHIKVSKGAMIRNRYNQVSSWEIVRLTPLNNCKWAF